MPESRHVAAVLAVDSFNFTGREGTAEALQRAASDAPEWVFAQARYRYALLVRSGDRDPAACGAVLARFASLGTACRCTSSKAVATMRSAWTWRGRA
ncbi:MAG: hypothetical protein AUI14_09880 [Actinobacteria bacterium 13_2_20CM_2_71_6]|nr:MAG: hypothetical protein AUI14_09880 [Actinobacteria bacterium 13_2_20CM_2_71_6]